MLSAAELSAMRETCEDAFPDTATIHRDTMESDGLGGRVIDETDSTTTLLCRIAEPSGQDRERAKALQLDIIRRMDFPHDADVRATDRIEVGGETYQVLFVSSDMSWALTGIAYLGLAV